MRKRHSMNVVLWMVLGLCPLLLACAAGISRQARDQVTYMDTFSTLQKTPERYMGNVVILGGKVIETRVEDGSTELILLQLPLNRWDRPEDSDKSEGRFILRSDQFVDPALYPAGTRITMVGRLVDRRGQPIGKMVYQYPVFQLIEIKKWPPAESRQPRFHFGVGVGTSF